MTNRRGSRGDASGPREAERGLKPREEPNMVT